MIWLWYSLGSLSPYTWFIHEGMSSQILPGWASSASCCTPACIYPQAPNSVRFQLPVKPLLAFWELGWVQGDVSNQHQQLWKHQSVPQEPTLPSPVWDNGELSSLWGSLEHPRDVLLINQLVTHFWVCLNITGLICGTQRVAACSAMLPPLAFTHFSTNLQEVLLQFHDLLLNRLSLVLTHDNPSQPGNAGCITAHVNAKPALIQKHQKKELGVNLT